MEQVLKHLQEDKKTAEKEEKKHWDQLITNNHFKEAMKSDSFKQWFLKYMSYSQVLPDSILLKWRKSIEKIKTLDRMIEEVDEKNTQWKIVEKLKNHK